MPLNAGDAAPYTGQLLGTKLAIRIGQLADQCEHKLQLERKRCNDLAAIDKIRTDGILAAEVEATRGQLASMQERLMRAQQAAADAEPPFYAKPWFVAPVVAVGTAVAVVWAARQ